jgi:protein phosphatase
MTKHRQDAAVSDTDLNLADTSSFDFAELATAARSTPSNVEVQLAALTDRGKVRANNEDHYLALEFGRYLNCLHTNLPPADVPRFDQKGYALLVADGMGGSAAGEVASRLAITTLIELALETPDWIMGRDERLTEEVQRRTADRIQQASDALVREGNRRPELAGMGTTMTIAISLGRDLLVAHVGDSRAYLHRRGYLLRLTRDHTLAQEMADAGAIPMSDVSTHRLRHVLTRSLGEDRSVRTEFSRLTLQEGDRLLLCSDGLTDMVDDIEISRVLTQLPACTDACRVLTERALENGGRDNVTVLVADYRKFAN